jgi:hypothetical protein
MVTPRLLIARMNGNGVKSLPFAVDLQENPATPERAEPGHSEKP